LLLRVAARDSTVASRTCEYCGKLLGETARVWTSDMIDRQNKSIDRNLSVAPMMDWTDDLNSAFYIKSLGLLEMA
jgi:hypothetical protein